MKKNYKIIVIFLLVFGTSFSQERTSLKGKVNNNMGTIVNGSIINLNSKTRVTISVDGYFEVAAKSKDTLLVSALACLPKKIVVSNKNTEASLLQIELELFDNELKEVIILNQKEIRPVPTNTQKIVDRKYFDDNQSSPTNSLMPFSPIPNGTDFVRLFKEFKKILKKKNSENEALQKPINYYKEVVNRVPTDFFSKTLQLNNEEILLFLSFCENDKRAITVLNLQDDFMLYDFLIGKNKDFKSFSTFEK